MWVCEYSSCLGFCGFPCLFCLVLESIGDWTEVTGKTATRLEATLGHSLDPTNQPLLPNLTFCELLDNSTACALNREKEPACAGILSMCFHLKRQTAWSRSPGLGGGGKNYFSNGVCMPQNTSHGRAPREVRSTDQWRAAHAFPLPFLSPVPSSWEWSA